MTSPDRPRATWSRTGARLVAMVAALALAAGLLTVVTSAPATAATIPASDCRSFDPGLVHGICYQTSDGRKTWLGNFKNPAGERFFCIDKDKSSKLPAHAPIHSTVGLKNQNGLDIGPRKVAALNYVVWKWGTTTSDRRAAAIQLIIREVMSDTGGQLPSGLGIGETVKAPSGGFPSEVLDQARSMWREASDSYGPWNVTLTGDTATSMRPGESRTLLATVTGGAGTAVAGTTITLAYSGPVTGPATVTSGSGPAPVVVTATGGGRFSVTASIVGPAANGNLFDPADNAIQRGWIAIQQPDSVSITLVGKVFLHLPVVTTNASSAVVAPGMAFHDTVTVADSALSQTATATLYGPYAAQPGAADCTKDKVASTVTFPVTGAGTYDTPDVTADDVGYYTWQVDLPGDGDTEPTVTSSCGDVAETTFVNLRPLVRTLVSKHIADPGTRLFDKVDVSGLSSGDTATVTWTLYGPVKAGKGSCARVPQRAWKHTAVVASGSFVADHNGLYTTTRSPRLTRIGCYSYGESLPATPSHVAYVHPVGLVSQSALVRHGVHVDTGPEGFASRTMLDRTAGSRISFPGHATGIPVVRVGERHGEVVVPDDAGVAGWDVRTRRAAATEGSSLVVGHISDEHDNPGAFAVLLDLAKGDRVVWLDKSGHKRVYEVISRTKVKRTSALPSRLWDHSGPRRLNLVTCTDKVTNGEGYFHYTKNLIVTAKPVEA